MSEDAELQRWLSKLRRLEKEVEYARWVFEENSNRGTLGKLRAAEQALEQAQADYQRFLESRGKE